MSDLFATVTTEEQPPAVVEPAATPEPEQPAAAVQSIDLAKLYEKGKLLRESTAAVTLSFRWFGNIKTVKGEARTAAAEALEANAEDLRVAAQLFAADDCPELSALNAIRAKIQAFWRQWTLPYIYEGQRLMGKDRVSWWLNELKAFQAELETAKGELAKVYEQRIDARRAHFTGLGLAFDRSKYPALDGIFTCSAVVQEVNAPDFLAATNQDVWAEQCQLAQQRAEAAWTLAETAFAEELVTMTDHIADRLTPGADGKAKARFHGSNLDKVLELVDQFRKLPIGQSERLKEHMDALEQAVKGIDPAAVKHVASVRTDLANKMQALTKDVCERFMVKPPARKVVRKSKDSDSSDNQAA